MSTSTRHLPTQIRGWRLCMMAFCLFTSSTLLAQDKLTTRTLPGQSEQRKALLIGNRTYSHFRPLSNTERDVDAMATLLRTLNFTVTAYKNLEYRSTVQALASFKASLAPNDIALVYYSGHGIGTGSESYLIPVEADLRCTSELEGYGPLSLNSIINGLASRQVRNSFVFLDACRNLPLTVCEGAKSGEATQGLVMPKKQPKGNLIVFATGEGKTADDDRVDKTNSLFTAELLKHLATPNLGIREIIDNVLEGVETRSQGRQVPQKLEDLRGNFVFVKTQPPPSTPVKSLPQTRQYLDLPFADMVYVPGGTFQMGDTRNEGDSDEKPVHTVTVSSFLMGKYEVTQRQWEAVMGSNPSYFKDCPDCPVESVSWDDVQLFLQKLNARTGGSYRLPTEAEWEYAAGGGKNPNRSRFGNGRDVLDPVQANFNPTLLYTYSVEGMYRQKIIPVGSFDPNGLGLYDMSGNVWEWCSDWDGSYSNISQTNPTGPSIGTYRVMRGGSLDNNASYCRSTDRANHNPVSRHDYLGFRIVSPVQ